MSVALNLNHQVNIAVPEVNEPRDGLLARIAQIQLPEFDFANMAYICLKNRIVILVTISALVASAIVITNIGLLPPIVIGAKVILCIGPIFSSGFIFTDFLLEKVFPTHVNDSNRYLSLTPNYNGNVNLEKIYLDSNLLTQGPDFTRNRNLTYVTLHNNRLTRSPVFGPNHSNLLDVYLHGNQLETLHDSILTLPRNCVVHAENNRFSPEYVRLFQARLAEQRQLDPSRGPTVHMSIHDQAAGVIQAPIAGNTLETQLQEWSRGFRAPLDFAPLLNLDELDRELLLQYLNQLKLTADYKDLNDPAKRAQKNIVFRVENMLRLACANPEFKDKLLGLMREGSESCYDRTILLFNDIEVQWQIDHKEHNAEELADLSARIERYELLKKHAIREAVVRQLGDRIETILYYQIMLKNDLQLPITTEGMLYAGVAGVTPEMLTAAKQEIGTISRVDLLSGSELWRTHLKKNNAQPFEQLEERFGDMLENPPENLNSGQYRDHCNRIREEREAALRQLTKELTN